MFLAKRRFGRPPYYNVYSSPIKLFAHEGPFISCANNTSTYNLYLFIVVVVLAGSHVCFCLPKIRVCCQCWAWPKKSPFLCCRLYGRWLVTLYPFERKWQKKCQNKRLIPKICRGFMGKSCRAVRNITNISANSMQKRHVNAKMTMKK